MKNSDLEPGTNVKINCTPAIGRSAIVIAPSRQGDECIIVETDSDDFNHQVLVVNVHDVTVIRD